MRSDTDCYDIFLMVRIKVNIKDYADTALSFIVSLVDGVVRPNVLPFTVMDSLSSNNKAL